MIHSTPSAPSHSRLACISECERKYFYRYHLGLETSQQFAPAYMGSCTHEALEVWHRTGDAAAALAQLESAWGSQRFTGDWDWVTAGHASIILRKYMESKHTQDWQVVRLRRADLKSAALLHTDVTEDDAGYLVLAEASFIVDVPGLGPVNIRPDLLLQGYSGLRVVDHKTTTSYLGSKMYNAAKYGHQLRLYALALSTLLDQPVNEGGINGIYTGKTASSDKFKGTAFDTFSFDYQPADFDETRAWYHQRRLRMEHIAEHFTEADELGAPQNPGERCGYCEFNSLCGAPPVMRPGVMKQYRRVK